MSRLCLLLLALATAALAAAADLPAPGHPLAGTWHFDAARSTELSPWRDYVFTLTVDGDRVTIARQFGSGRRQFADTQTIDLSRPDNVVPVTLWPDNRHLGAYIGGDRTKHVRGEWLDAGRILRLSTDLVLSTQQGDRAVNILSDYKVSANGTRLTLTELRSTRNRPVVYSFTRAANTPK
ncbi:MAG TPA: hypothetical protein VGD97_14620 [Lacunisphaera sp.]